MGSGQVDIKRFWSKPTLFDNKLQLIIYSSSTNFYTGFRRDFYVFHHGPTCACRSVNVLGIVIVIAIVLFSLFFSHCRWCYHYYCYYYHHLLGLFLVNITPHFHMILRADTSTVIYGRDKLETNGKIMLKKRLLFMYANPTHTCIHISESVTLTKAKLANELCEWKMASVTHPYTQTHEYASTWPHSRIYCKLYIFKHLRQFVASLFITSLRIDWIFLLLVWAGWMKSWVKFYDFPSLWCNGKEIESLRVDFSTGCAKGKLYSLNCECSKRVSLIFETFHRFGLYFRTFFFSSRKHCIKRDIERMRPNVMARWRAGFGYQLKYVCWRV